MFQLRGLSLFSNVGVAEAYFEDIGVKVPVANELIEKRAAFYKEVYPETKMIVGDITKEEIRDEIVKVAIKEKVNLIIATPPCQGMSVAGNRDPDDIRNQLISYAIDVIHRIKPDFVFLENVPRQLKTKININGESIGIPDYIKRELEEGYTFNPETLAKAKDFGVPQLRERNIYLLVKKELGIVWGFPEKQEEVTLEKAIGGLPSLDPILREGMQLTLEKFPEFEIKKENAMKISKWHRPPTHPWRQVEWMMHTPTGKSAIFNEVYYPCKKDGTPIKAHHNHYRRMNWDKPSRTITMFNGFLSTLATAHPGREFQFDGFTLFSDARVLSIYELLTVMSIPETWSIPEWADDSFLRSVIGEGIPSKMARDIMLNLITRLNEKRVTCN
ncbi:DNA cytosine methyltransferase [Paenibacillus wynnii]|uniref:DNA cytosine methyltransferase n=1 Tax=Paenibacillus wynnii TaxID=268407 RepID=UPI0027931F69|nr:DNA cytosine methyltransferase [Paenibacillus wynnii]MDQ0195736.1 DNA (cytosine-5)-methyltransferase 1 [Paenibacillus wynnii]